MNHVEGWKKPSESKNGLATAKVFNAVKITFLPTINWFLSDSQKQLMGSGFRLEFLRIGLSNRINGLFINSALTGILVASDYDAVESVIPLFGSIVGECCSLDKTADTTKVFTTYFDMTNLLYRKYLNPWWSKDDLNLRQKEFRNFKAIAWKMFSSY